MSKWLNVIKDVVILGLGVVREAAKARREAHKEPIVIPSNDLEDFDAKVNREVRGLWESEQRKKRGN